MSPPYDCLIVPDAHRVLPIVVGASLRGELGDRPIAEALVDRVRALTAPLGIEPVVMSDLWYLNQHDLCAQPAISIGPPGVNALTASLAARVPSAFVVDDSMMVQFDVDRGDGSAVCWGVDPRATRAGVEVFAERYLGQFVEGLMAGVTG